MRYHKILVFVVKLTRGLKHDLCKFENTDLAFFMERFLYLFGRYLGPQYSDIKQNAGLFISQGRAGYLMCSQGVEPGELDSSEGLVGKQPFLKQAQLVIIFVQ